MNMANLRSMRNHLQQTVAMLMAVFVTSIPASHAADALTLNADDTRHLLNRTGFAASQVEISAFTGLTRQAAVQKIMAGAQDTARTASPKWVDSPIIPASKYRDMTREEREEERKLNAERALDLREWWFREMLDTPSPLTEKMTLFWHNHFATSQQKVRHSTLMYRQNVMLRQHAMGNFGVMLHQLARDPAMLIYLDNANSRKEQPNENFAREVMELFTLGEGNYTEQDIKEMARAFTGWSIDRENGEFMFRRNIHDAGEKTIFSKKGNFDGNQALDLLLKRPETATFITRKLWREFISPEPDEKAVAQLATIYRDASYNTATLMTAILTSDAFYAADNRASLIKSPIELVVGTMKQFDIETGNMRPFVIAAALLGQNLFQPPNVKGWPGGQYWINSATLLGRKQFIDRLFKNEDRMEAAMNALDEMAERSGTPAPPGRAQRQQRVVDRQMAALKWDLATWAQPFAARSAMASKTNAGLESMSKLLLAVAPRSTPKSAAPADWARALVNDPSYQLK